MTAAQAAPKGAGDISYARARGMAGARWQGALAQCCSTGIDVVVQRVEGRHALADVEDHHPGAGVAAARLAHRARVEQHGLVGLEPHRARPAAQQ